MVRVMLICLLLAGCAHKECKPVIEPYPKAQIPERPTLPVQVMDENTSEEDVAKAYVISIKELQKWGLELEKKLGVYK